SGTVEHIFSGQQRELSSSTVVKNPTLISGTPFDLQIPLRSGGLDTLHLVTGVTVVDTDTLLEVSPGVFEGRRSKTVYDPRIGCLVDRQQIRLGKRILEGVGHPRLEDTHENRKLFAQEFTEWAHEQLERQRRNLERFHKRVPSVSPQQVADALRARADGIVALDQLSKSDKEKVIALTKLETYFGDEFVYKLGRPRRQPKLGKRRDKGWQPRHKRRKGPKQRRDNW